MKLHKELTKGLVLLERKTIHDDRGFFQRIFCPSELKDFWGERKVYQVNRSFTKNIGAFRGFHYQKEPSSEMKFIQCVAGGVLDFAIDLRAGSPTFMKVFSYELSVENNLCVIIPEGFAHGFQVLKPNSELIYFHSAPYAKELEGGISYLDTSFEIKFPIPVVDVSARDLGFKFIDKTFKGIGI